MPCHLLQVGMTTIGRNDSQIEQDISKYVNMI